LDQRGIHPTVNIASPPLYIEGKPYFWMHPSIVMKIHPLAAAKEGENLLHISTKSKEEEGARGHCPLGQQPPSSMGRHAGAASSPPRAAPLHHQSSSTYTSTSSI
jgi:hypothetical protein